MSLRHLTIAALIGLSAAPPAFASHYRLPIADFITPAETDLLGKAGITTTLALLEAVTTPARRTALGKKTGLAEARVDALAAQVDLLRFDGIGPSVVRLLQASGIPHARALASANPATLHATLTSVNATAKILGAIPPEALVAAWIGKAKAAPLAVEGLR